MYVGIRANRRKEARNRTPCRRPPSYLAIHLPVKSSCSHTPLASGTYFSSIHHSLAHHPFLPKNPPAFRGNKNIKKKKEYNRIPTTRKLKKLGGKKRKKKARKKERNRNLLWPPPQTLFFVTKNTFFQKTKT